MTWSEVRRKRIEAGASQVDLAARAKVSRSLVAAGETDRVVVVPPGVERAVLDLPHPSAIAGVSVYNTGTMAEVTRTDGSTTVLLVEPNHRLDISASGNVRVTIT